MCGTEEPGVVISRPRKVTLPDGVVKLVAAVRAPDCQIPEEMFFLCEARYADYLVDERADAFLVGLIPLILQTGGRVRCEAPVSKRLLHNLRYGLSNLLKEFKGAHWGTLKIDAEGEDTCFAGSHVGTGCSCGVDSSATIALYTGEDVSKDMRIDTLAFFNVGSHGDFRNYTDKERRACHDLYLRRRERAESLAGAAGLPLLCVESNVYEFGAGYSHLAMVTFRNVAAVLALGKWFSAYLFASSFHATQFEFSIGDVAECDFYLLDILSTESTRLISTLGAYYRYERGPLFADYKPAQRYLDVCVKRVGNCTSCVKCVRTMFQFDMAGILDRFGESLDVSYYRAHPWRMLQYLMKDQLFHVDFLAQMKDVRRRGEWGLPFSFWTYRFFFCLGEFLERCADVRRAVKRFLGLDKK